MGHSWNISSNTTGREDGLEGKKWKYRLDGGVLGIFTGGLGVAYTILLLSFAVLSTQDDPSFSPWAILAVSLISAATGAIIGGRWKAMSRLFLTYIGSISLSLLLSTSFRIKAKLGRLIIFFIMFIMTFILSFIFSLLPRSTLQHVSNRLAFFLTTTTGSWLIFSIGIDLFIRTGLFDAPTLFTSQSGIFKENPYIDSNNEGDVISNVVKWNLGKCKGLLAGMWLFMVIGTAFQQWRYSIIGDDPEESWNTYLGSLLSNDKTLIRNSNNSNSGGGSLSENNRAGTFIKSENWFKRSFRSSSEKKRRMMPATYMLPSEQHDGHIISDTVTPGLHGDHELHEEEMMREVHSPGVSERRRTNAPAKYDSFGYSTVGLGLYDAGADAREAYYATPYDDEPSSSRNNYDARGGRSNLLPTYNPDLYTREQKTGLQRHDSEPSFQSVPKYSPPRIENTVESNSIPDERDGTYTNRIVEEPEHDQIDRRQTFIAPLSPQARASEARFQSQQVEGGEGLRSVPIPATPSLLNAIKRVSEAQAQARQYRIKEQQAQLSASSYPSLPSRVDGYHIASSSSSETTAATANGTINTSRIPENERIALKQAAIRRQTSAEWWSEVERKANEKAIRDKERGSPAHAALSNQRISSLPGHAGSSAAVVRGGSINGWRSSSVGNDRGRN